MKNLTLINPVTYKVTKTPKLSLKIFYLPYRYAVLAVLHHGDLARDRNRATQYAPWLNELNFGDIPFPFCVGSLKRFESLNPSLAIRLLQWKDEETKLLRAAPLCPERRVVNILLVGDHYVGVTNLNRLLNDWKLHNHNSRLYRERCIRPFFTQSKLEQHKPFCLRNIPQHVVMPKESHYQFTKWAKTLSPSHVIYADIECLLLPGEGNLLQRHSPIAAAYLVTSQ